MTANPCDVKVLYDTEFEATIAAAKESYRLSVEMIPYRCPQSKHWHIANADRKLRSRNNPNSHRYCRYCDVYMRKGRWDKHVQKPRHKKLKADFKEV